MIDIILKFLKKELFNKDSEFDKIVWDDVWKETRVQAIGTLVFSGADKCGFKFDEDTQNKAANQLTRINRSFMGHKRVAQILEEAKIPYVIIKGVISSSYYPDPYVRPMGDVDVLVKKEDLKKTCEVFKNKGFVLKKEDVDFDKKHHMNFMMGNQSIELHFELPGIPENKMRKEIHSLTDDIFEKPVDYDSIYGKIKGPSPFHHGLIMLLHMQGHMQSGGMGLRHLCDWATFVGSFKENDFVSVFKEKLESIGLWYFACLMCQVSFYVGLDQEEWMGNDEELAKILLEDITSGGNFGRKDNERMNSARYLPKVQNGKKRKTQLGQYVSYGIGITPEIWPFFKKHKWLMPVGFVCYCVRTAYRLITKKSKVYDLSENNKRYDVYSKLKLFEK